MGSATSATRDAAPAPARGSRSQSAPARAGSQALEAVPPPATLAGEAQLAPPPAAAASPPAPPPAAKAAPPAAAAAAEKAEAPAPAAAKLEEGVGGLVRLQIQRGSLPPHAHGSAVPPPRQPPPRVSSVRTVTDQAAEARDPIFVIYDAADAEFVSRLVASLEWRGVQGLRQRPAGGADADDTDADVEEYEAALCDVALACLSRSFYRNSRARKQLKVLARRKERGERVELMVCALDAEPIPVDLSYALGGGSMQIVLFGGLDFEEGVERLARPLHAAVKARIAGIASHLEEEPESVLPPKLVFVSYCSKDSDIVWPIVEGLDGEDSPLAGDLWIDRKRLVVGSDWDSQIAEALYAARVALIFLSPRFFQSVNCSKEVKMLARRVEAREDVRLVPVVIDPCEVPVALRYALGQVEAAANVVDLVAAFRIPEAVSRVAAAVVPHLRDDDETAGDKTSPEELQRFVMRDQIIHGEASLPVSCLGSTAHRMFTGGWDGNVRVWDATTHAPVATLSPRARTPPLRLRPQAPQHAGRVRAMRVLGTAEGGYLLTGAGGASGPDDPLIRVWSLETLQLVQELEGHLVGVLCFGFDDGLLYSGGADFEVRVWDTPLRTGSGGFTHRAKLPISKRARRQSNSSQHLGPGAAVGSTHGGVTGIAACRGRLFVAAWLDHEDTQFIHVYKSATLELVAKVAGHTDYIRDLCVRREFVFTAAGGKDRTARMYDPDTLDCLRVFSGHTKGVQSVYTGNGSLRDYLITASNDGVARVFDVRTGACVHSNNFKEDAESFYCVWKPADGEREWFLNAVTITAGQMFAAGAGGLVLVYGPPEDTARTHGPREKAQGRRRYKSVAPAEGGGGGSGEAGPEESEGAGQSP